MATLPPTDPDMLAALTPKTLTNEERAAMTLRCRDADPIPKVPGAGQVFEQPDGQKIQLMHNGVRVVAGGYYGDSTTRLIEQSQGHHEPQEERVFHEVVSRLPPGGTMIELGGYWAYYSIWFLRAAPGRRAILIEPDPAHLAVGQANVALNGVDAEFIHGFVGGVPGTVAQFETEASGIRDTPCHGVGLIMNERGIDKLTILHCDIQGAEFSVLTQATSLFTAGRIEWLFVSTHHHYLSGDPLLHQRCLALIRKLGGTIVAEHDTYESFSGDGLICARFCPAPPGFEPPPLSYNRASESLFPHALYDVAAGGWK